MLNNYNTRAIQRQVLEKYTQGLGATGGFQRLDGTQCLRWASTKDRKAAALKVALPSPTHRDWTPFEAVEFWMLPTVPPRGMQAVVRCAGARGAGPGGAAAKSYLYSPVAIQARSGQWTRVRLKLDEMKAQGVPQIASVSDFQLQIPAGSQFDFRIDRIAVIRRERPATRK